MNRIHARAKINLTLNVRPLPGTPDQRAASLYHELTSVFHLIERADEITWQPAESGHFELTCTGQGLEKLPREKNLAWKAAQAFARATECELPALHVHIEKHIPSGSGLAGGSADAAAVLLLLAREATNTPGTSVAFCRCGLRTGISLQQIAVTLGADVAFFLADSAACLMGGIGDELHAALRPAVGVPIVIAWDPAAPVSTPQVYQAFEQHLLPVDLAGEAALTVALTPPNCADIEQVASHLYNNLSAAAYTVSPAARKVFEFLDDAPQAIAAALSGSGGASFALCASLSDCDALARNARAAGFAACATELAGQTLSEQCVCD